MRVALRDASRKGFVVGGGTSDGAESAAVDVKSEGDPERDTQTKEGVEKDVVVKQEESGPSREVMEALLSMKRELAKARVCEDFARGWKTRS